MAVSTALKNRAFLCSAYGDDDGANWLLKKIQGYKLQPEIVEKAKLPGPTDASGRASLRPIYRPGYLSLSGTALPGDTLARLDASAALIVLCTSMAAGDRAVNEAVRYFKHRHPDRPIIPVVTDKALGMGLPPALRFAMNPDGTIGREPMPVAPIDLRENGDGKSYGMAKVVSSLLGIDDVNPIYRSANARDAKASQRGWTAGLAAMALAFGGAAVWGEGNRQQAATERANALTQAKLVTEQKASFEAGTKELTDLKKLVEVKSQEAATHAKVGTEQSGLVTLLRKNADSQDAVIAGLRKDVEAMKVATAAAKPVVVAQADTAASADLKALVETLKREVEDQRKTTNIWFDIAQKKGKEAEGKSTAGGDQLALVDKLRKELDDQRKATDIQYGLAEQRRKEAEGRGAAAGDQLALVERLRKELDDQRRATDIQYSLAEQRRKEAEGNSNTSSEKTGELGRLQKDLKDLQRSAELQASLAEERRKDLAWQRLVVANQLSELERLRADLNAQRSLAALRLTESNTYRTDLAGWKGLAVRRGHETDAQKAEADAKRAEADAYRKDLAGWKGLAVRRGTETDAQRAEAERIRLDADMRLSAADETADMLALAMLKGMRGHPDLVGQLADNLMASIERVAGERVDRRSNQADSLRRQQAIFDELALLYGSRNNAAGREKATRRSLEVSQRLAETDKGSPAALGELATSHIKTGDLYVAQGKLTDAFKSYQDAVFLRERLAANDPASLRALALGYEGLGRVRTAQKDGPGARLSYQQALATVLKLSEPAVSETENIRLQIALLRGLDRLGDDPLARRKDVARLLLVLKARGIVAPGLPKARAVVRVVPGVKASKATVVPAKVDTGTLTVPAASPKPVVKRKRVIIRKVKVPSVDATTGG
jgi:hypothetical protein